MFSKGGTHFIRLALLVIHFYLTKHKLTESNQKHIEIIIHFVLVIKGVPGSVQGAMCS